MTAQIIHIRNEEEKAWDAYVRARDVAQRSNRIEDGIAAGRAWAAFLELFLREGVSG